MPQGGIEEGEQPSVAALRELKEETGTSNVRIIGEARQWLSYDFPAHLIGKVWGGRYRGQTQKWFAMVFCGDDSEIDPEGVLKPEFDEWKWIVVDDLIDTAVSFKRDVYRKVIEEFSPLLTD